MKHKESVKLQRRGGGGQTSIELQTNERRWKIDTHLFNKQTCVTKHLFSDMDRQGQ